MMHVKEVKRENIPMIEPGIYQAVCCSLIYLGEQFSTLSQKYQNRILSYWILPGEYIKMGDKEYPRRVCREFTVSLDAKSNLRKVLESWRGRPYTEEEAQDVDLSKLLGVGAQIQIMHKPKQNGEMKAVVENVLPLPKGVQMPPVETMLFDLDDPATYSVFNQLPEWVQKRISQAQGFADTGLVVSVTNESQSAAPAQPYPQTVQAAVPRAAAPQPSAYSAQQSVQPAYPVQPAPSQPSYAPDAVAAVTATVANPVAVAAASGMYAPVGVPAGGMGFGEMDDEPEDLPF